MKKHYSLVLCLVGLNVTTPRASAAVVFFPTKVAFNAAAHTTLIEDFSTAPGSSSLSTFSLHGVTYTALGQTDLRVTSPGYHNFGAGVGVTTNYILASNHNEDFKAVFSAPYNAVGFDTYLNGLGPASVHVYNGATLLATFTYDGTLDDKEYLGIVSSEPITSFSWTGTNGATLNTGIGNLSVGQNWAIATFGAWTNQVGFTITGTPDLVVVVEACINLPNPAWSIVGTNTLSAGSSYFNDSGWTNYPARYYRLGWP